jgi:hypothetical protein
MDNRISHRPQPKPTAQQPKATGDASNLMSRKVANNLNTNRLSALDKISPQSQPRVRNKPLFSRAVKTQPVDKKANKSIDKKLLNPTVIWALMQSHNSADFDAAFKAIDWVFASKLDAEQAFKVLGNCLSHPNEIVRSNAKRLLQTFSNKKMYTFMAKTFSPTNDGQKHCEGAVILGLAASFLELGNPQQRLEHLKIIKNFVEELLINHPTALFSEDSSKDNIDLISLLRACEMSKVPLSEWYQSLGFILNPHFEVISKFLLWGNWFPLEFSADHNYLFKHLTLGGGFETPTQLWMQNILQKWDEFGLEANPSYQPLWEKGAPYIKEMIQSFEDNSFSPQNIENLANRIQANKATAIGISMYRHFLSASVIGDFLLLNNYGGALDLKTCRPGENYSPGTLIFKLKENTSLNQIWTPKQVEGLKDQSRNPEGFEEAMDNIFENYDVIGAYDARGQTRGNCGAKHNFLHIFNGLMVAAYELQSKAEGIHQEFLSTLAQEEDTHTQRRFKNTPSTTVRGQPVPFCNDDVLVQMASRMYRDMTLFMRTEAFLDVANDEDGIQFLSNTLSPENPEALIEEFRGNINETLQDLLWLYDKRLVKQSAANKGLELKKVGFNTFHKKNNEPFGFNDYIKSHLDPNSEFARMVLNP